MGNLCWAVGRPQSRATERWGLREFQPFNTGASGKCPLKGAGFLNLPPSGLQEQPLVMELESVYLGEKWRPDSSCDFFKDMLVAWWGPHAGRLAATMWCHISDLIRCRAGLW